MHWIFPNALIFPGLADVRSINTRSCTTERTGTACLPGCYLQDSDPGRVVSARASSHDEPARPAAGQAVRSGAMPVNRMNREEFYAKVSALGAEQLRKVLWTLYWRGTAQVRER